MVELLNWSCFGAVETCLVFNLVNTAKSNEHNVSSKCDGSGGKSGKSGKSGNSGLSWLRATVNAVCSGSATSLCSRQWFCDLSQRGRKSAKIVILKWAIPGWTTWVCKQSSYRDTMTIFSNVFFFRPRDSRARRGRPVVLKRNWFEKWSPILVTLLKIIPLLCLSSEKSCCFTG